MHDVWVIGKAVIFVGKSRMVGMPTAAMLSSGGVTVTWCDVHTDATTLKRKASLTYLGQMWVEISRKLRQGFGHRRGLVPSQDIVSVDQ